jgi:hypothetical protein
VTCPRCDGTGWVCADHPHEPKDHPLESGRMCPGAGMPCEEPGCSVGERKAAEASDEAHAILRPIKARGTTGVRAGDILTLLRRHDIPCSIDSFAAQGWTAKLGDPAKGFYAQHGHFRTIEAAANWLLEETKRHYPDVMPGS